MLLKNAGIKHPLVCIFAGTAFGICVLLQDIQAASFSFLMLIMLFSIKRLPHILAGIMIGALAFFFSVRPAGYEGEHMISGRIVSSGFEYGTLRIELKNVHVDGKKVRGRARLGVYENTDLPSSEDISTSARLSFPSGPDNFAQNDIRYALLAEGITITGYVNDFKDIRFSGKKVSGTRPAAMLDSAGSNEAGVLKAILTGDRSGLTPHVNDLFASLGLSHLIAISGLNFGLVIFFGYLLSFNIIRIIPPLAQRLDTPLVSKAFGLICAIAYGMIVEPSFPTIRALVMACIVIGAFMAARRVNLIDSLAFSGILILAFWPCSLFTASFLLSFAAVLGIISAVRSLEKRGLIVQLFAVTFIAAVFTMPLSVYCFGFISPLSIIFNLIFVPVFSFIIMPLSLIGMLMSYVWVAGGTYLFGLCMDAVSLILMTGERFGSLIPVPKPDVWYFYLLYAVLFISLYAKRSLVKFIILAPALISLIIIPFYIQHQKMEQPLTFDFISVGHGDCILITKGRHSVLIDAGGSFTGFDTGRFIAGPRLLSRGITKLDLVIATHSHPDHIGGLPFILKRFEIGQLWVNRKDDPDFNDVFLVTNMKRIPVITVKTGDAMLFPNGMKIEVIYPINTLENPGKKLDLNLHSIIVTARDDRLSGLFMADSDMFGEVNMVHMEKTIKADILKAAHHGSKKSCLDIFLEAVEPEAAVITCGKNNRFGLPSEEALSRLNSAEVSIFRTDQQGEVIISKNSGDIMIKSFSNRAEKNPIKFRFSLLGGAVNK
jgi:competence protein ComEC